MKGLNLTNFYKQFPDEQACLEYLEKVRWPSGRACPHCGSLKTYKFKNGKLFKCGEKECRKQFTAKVGTIFSDSHIPLQKWFMAVYLLTSHKKGVSSITIAEHLDITQKSAWFVLQRIRYAMEYGLEKPLDNTVEMDETYGSVGKAGKKTRGRGTDKVPIFGMVERGGSVKAYVTPFLGREIVEPLIRKSVKPTATVNTDYFSMYKKLIPNMGYKHERINHSKGQYAKGKVHTNTIEGYWSHLKASIDCIYIGVSPKHLQRYCDESSYRWNVRDMENGDRFETWFKGINRHLPYKKLVG